ncbi:glycosyltransferase [Methylocystis heyeri]|uniref:Glycosyltransferase n=1 Tax=Methylocystis heyeri TaxID=391905 RepID=A0A6B8KAN0_9HYPH|nr:glycosyltransferase [Methylocystis heyeri]QGM44532.1 glycosyltransferase [Methylocystis heyeri]
MNLGEGLSLSEALTWFGAFHWVVSVLLLAFSSIATVMQPWLTERRAKNRLQPPVSVVLPVKLLEDSFETAQESVLAQSYRQFEALASAVDPQSEASQKMRRIFERHPEVATRFLASTANGAKSPKVNNLVAPFTEATNDVIFMKDANAVLAPGDLAEHLRQLTDQVGLVCAIPYGANAENLAAHIEASILNGPHQRMLYLASAFGHGFGVGKIMLFRRSDFLRAGGFHAISHTVGEDNAMAKALARIGLKTVFSHRAVRQDLGRRCMKDVYQRQLRWSVIRRGDVLLSFLLEPFCQAFPSLIAAALAAPLVGLTPFSAVAGTLCLWLASETLLSFAKGWRLSWDAPAILLFREAVMLAVWLQAWITNQVVWANENFDARTDSPRVVCTEAPLKPPVMK